MDVRRREVSGKVSANVRAGRATMLASLRKCQFRRQIILLLNAHHVPIFILTPQP